MSPDSSHAGRARNLKKPRPGLVRDVETVLPHAHATMWNGIAIIRGSSCLPPVAFQSYAGSSDE